MVNQAGKSLDTLVKDIYDLMLSKKTLNDLDSVADKFGKEMSTILKQTFKPVSYNKDNVHKLRMSNIGKSHRYLWYHYNGYQGEKLQAHTLIKFMYGHLIEEMVLALVRLAGHEVTDEQKEAELQDITGHMDCKIDGVVVDVKSTSSYGFKKFKDGTLYNDDPFGYINQIKGYTKAENATEGAFLAMDKQNGTLTVLNIDTTDNDIEEQIVNIKKMVKEKEPPVHCYDLVPDGKSGNMKLSVGCSYCQFKKHCYPDLRAFAYSTGPKFLAVVKKQPNVHEIIL